MKPTMIALVGLVCAGLLTGCARNAPVAKASHTIDPDINWGMRVYR
ncbi:hypothetical protein IV417_06905 [Alphaproteobacteria bacterium KMM 3653]|uniref:Lipoprotein n=1 Tax=Harenicola maris TaxID=2841044 RepID=A0AAP2CT28_9RHOB|nr:hypothetical protein [Harenicola maris]